MGADMSDRVGAALDELREALLADAGKTAELEDEIEALRELVQSWQTRHDSLAVVLGDVREAHSLADRNCVELRREIGRLKSQANEARPPLWLVRGIGQLAKGAGLQSARVEAASKLWHRTLRWVDTWVASTRGGAGAIDWHERAEAAEAEVERLRSATDEVTQEVLFQLEAAQAREKELRIEVEKLQATLAEKTALVESRGRGLLSALRGSR